MPAAGRICSRAGCGRAHYALGFCRRDHAQWTNSPRRPRWRRICSIIGCGRKHHAFGFCKRHYAAEIRNQARLYRETIYGKNFAPPEALAGTSGGTS